MTKINYQNSGSDIRVNIKLLPFGISRPGGVGGVRVGVGWGEGEGESEFTKGNR